MNDRFLRACRREPVDATPVWFMRQAGRYMAEYLEIRAKYSMLEVCRTPELATQVTLQPLRFGVDAAILFADILLPLEPMGAPFDFAKGEGPVVHEPIRTSADIDKLRLIDPEESLGYCLEAIRMLRRELKVPLIGFAGAPFTLASYLIEGGKSAHFTATKRLMYAEPEAWHRLMGKLAEVVRRFLRAQVAAGAQALQVFDSWVGQLGPDDYTRFIAPHMRAILSDVQSTGVPVIHFGTGTSTLLELMAQAGGTVIGVDWRDRLGEAWGRVGYDKAVQGNLDPTVLFAPRSVIQEQARAVLLQAATRPGHIFNLGHGILPGTPVEEVEALVDFVHTETSGPHSRVGSSPRGSSGPKD
ncbi:MAG: uroporphyrinogen decarboxylase [Deltaproteobacteria bacterium]|nr:uroporphyrinogen decarboxylase [Deltaproteobacteria bacterium]